MEYKTIKELEDRLRGSTIDELVEELATLSGGTKEDIASMASGVSALAVDETEAEELKRAFLEGSITAETVFQDESFPS
jgi:hypothetical protein